MLIEILYAIAAVAAVLSVCAAVKLLCKKYINIIEKRQRNKGEYYVQANFKN
jgi:phosphosulfolactate phosphohydrolase-like enzyme